jgi:hypothetical protein
VGWRFDQQTLVCSHCLSEVDVLLLFNSHRFLQDSCSFISNVLAQERNAGNVAQLDDGRLQVNCDCPIFFLDMV